MKEKLEGNENQQTNEGQTMQWPTEKGQKDKHQCTKHYTEN